MSPSQAMKLEIMMKQQVQDAVLARSVQLLRDNKLDSDWRLVGSLGQLKTFKIRGTDSFCSTSNWVTTSERSSRVMAGVHDRISTHSWTRRSRSSYRISSHRTMAASSRRHDPLPLKPSPPLQSFRTFGHIQGNYRDIVGVHYATNSIDFVQQQKLLSPVVIDGAVLHTIRATKDSYLGIKWLAVNTFAGKRDVCYVEMVGYTTDANGHEIGFVALASVDVPECPELTSPIKLTRVRMKRTMLVAPAAGAAKTTSEVFVMGASETNESSIATLAQYRLNMAVLNDFSLVIDSQNIAQQKLTAHKNWVPDKNRASCSICSRRFRFVFRRRHHCRLCGDVVCKTCYVNRAVPGTGVEDGNNCRSPTMNAICQTKFCVRCVMSLRVMDKRVGKLNQQTAETELVRAETSDVSETNVEQQSPVNVRDSSVTYFKRGTKQKYTLDLDQLYTMSASQNISSPEKDNSVEVSGTTARAIVASLLASHGGGGPKCLRPSLSIDPAHSNSYTKLCALSRHSSATSLGSKSLIERNSNYTSSVAWSQSSCEMR
ncbi:unnamed protein product [Peronospora belbahrii]|uniref:FYVE-type domain-containing protein n=1 Tax=Peronospora belbahrii TaxID=622444 RepID=A0AAU9L815_9STRA|nr:unnamed protein product [Peronospora belbahrii]